MNGWKCYAYLGREPALAYDALERSFFGVTAIVDFERRMAGECFEADVASGVATTYRVDRHLSIKQTKQTVTLQSIATYRQKAQANRISNMESVRPILNSEFTITSDLQLPS